MKAFSQFHPIVSAVYFAVVIVTVMLVSDPVLQAEALLGRAHELKVFITEAMWTRYMPLSIKIKELIDAGAIGEPRFLTANLCIPMLKKEKLFKPELCGGALLDVGVYCINFARMYFGGDIEKTVSSCQLWPTGVDIQDTISFKYRDGRMANLTTSGIASFPSMPFSYFVLRSSASASAFSASALSPKLSSARTASSVYDLARARASASPSSPT